MEMKVLVDLPRPAFVEQAPLQPSILDKINECPQYITSNQDLTYIGSSVLYERDSVANQIEELCKMPAGWDGYCALPISLTTKHNSLNALMDILSYTNAPDITPNPNGTLSFEWETAQGAGHLEIGQTRLSFYIQPKNGDPIFLDASADDLHASAINIGYLVSENLFQNENVSMPITKITLV